MENILPAVFQVVLDKLADFGLRESSSIFNFRNNVKKLEDALKMVEAVIEDAEEKQGANKPVKTWLSQLKDDAYESEALLLRLYADRSLLDSTYADKVEEKLAVLEAAAERFKLSLRESPSRVSREWECSRESYSSVIESEVYGREEDKEKLVELLMSCEATQGGGETMSCIPIVGVGGLGKTTLAKLAYNDHKVKEKFLRAWVFVSQDFDVRNILIKVIESITYAEWKLSAIDVAQKKVRELFQQKRFLIVLDDVWTEDPSDWETLREVLFGTGMNGSKILITCRSEKVSMAPKMAGLPTVSFDLRRLSDEISLSLFKRRAFGSEKEEKYQDLLEIASQIVKNCKGLPLALKSLGSLMRIKREVREWMIVRDSELWKLGKEIQSVLKLSYSHLPPHLKRCFLFCSIFPESFEFKKEKLIQLWMAVGLIENDGKRELEEIGNEYFTDLKWMSFFEEVQHYENDVITGYKIHDIIYELLQSVICRDEYAILPRDSQLQSFKRIRHSSICDFNSSAHLEKLYEAGHRLRTLLLYAEGNLNELPEKLCSIFDCLFVLDLSNSGLMKLEVSIGNLSYLTYLDLSHTLITKLPPQIEGLHYLQTLNLFNCYNLLALPDLMKMRSLRHLINEGCRELTRMVENYIPSGPCELRTLPLFVIGGVHDLVFLLNFSRLRGILKITHLENIDPDVWKRTFYICPKIESLGLYWGSDDGCPNINPEVESILSRFQERKEIVSSGPSQGFRYDPLKGEEVLSKISLPRNLKRLCIKGYPGFKFPDVEFLRNRCGMSRISFPYPCFWNFQRLTSLSLWEMHEVRSIGKDFCQANKFLEELILVDFPNLKEWDCPDSSGNAFPNLRKLILNKCPQLIVMPEILSLHHLSLRGCCATLLRSFWHLRSLETLVVGGVEDLTCFLGGFPLRNACLTTWEIKSCPLLSSLPNDLENLAALKSLVIR